MSGAIAAGLLHLSTGRHSITPCSALAVSERGRTARLLVIKVQSHYTAPTPTSLADAVSWRIEFKLAVLVYKCLHGLAPSYLADELHHPAESYSKASAFRFVS